MKKLLFSLAIMLTAVVTFSSCSGSDNEEPFTLQDKAMYVGDSVKVGTGATVENRFVAYVSKNGYLHAFHVGETTYSMNGSTAKIVVGGRHKAFDVITDWGISSSKLKSEVSGTPVFEKQSNGEYLVVYNKRGCANSLVYFFKNDRLQSAMALSSPVDEDEILDYLTERYIFLPEEVEAYTWGGSNGLDKEHNTTFVYLKLDTDYKYDYMLQTFFLSSKENTSETSRAKSLNIQMNKMVRSLSMMKNKRLSR